MRLDDKVRDHLEATTSQYPTKHVDLADVMARGNRLRWRARGAVAALSVAGLAVFAVVTVFVGSDSRRLSDAAVPFSEKPLHDEVLEGWSSSPDPVDPELAEIAIGLCEPGPESLQDGSPYLDDPSLLVIDQRGISARILLGGPTTKGRTAIGCGAIKVDGVWHRGQDIDEELPSMKAGSGGPLPDYVADVRLRLADGTEIIASVGGGEYLFHYPRTLNDAGSYIEQYSAEGALVSSEIYIPAAG